MPIKHSLQTAIHKPYAAIYADSAERLAATGFIRGEGGTVVPFDSNDLYKVVLQLENATEWFLSVVSPITWAAFTPTPHATSHQNGGSDEISVAGLSGVLADPQVPVTENVQDIVGAMVVEGIGIDVVYDDTANTLTITNSDPGSGASVTDEHIQDVVGAMLTDSSTIDFSYDDGAATATASLKPPAVNAQTGTAYTLQASDNGGIVTCSNASAITVTVPSGLGVGFNCMIIQKGAGQVTFSPSSTTINNRQSHTKSAGQHALVTLVADVANNFTLGGDTSS